METEGPNTLDFQIEVVGSLLCELNDNEMIT